MSEMKFFDMQSKANYPPLHNFMEYESALQQMKMYEIQIRSTKPLTTRDASEYMMLAHRVGDFEEDYNIKPDL